MKIGRKWVNALAALLFLVSMAALWALGEMYDRVCKYNAYHHCDVLAEAGSKPPVKAEKEQAKPKQDGNVHIVQLGDDLVSVAITHGISPSMLMDLNGLKAGDALKPGMELKLPVNRNSSPREQLEDPAISRRTVNSAGAPISQGVPHKAETPLMVTSSRPLSVKKVDYDGDRKISIVFTDRPDMEVARRYIKVEPMLEGNISLTYTTRYNYQIRDHEPIIRVVGEYAYHTNVVLKVLKGLPMFANGKQSVAGRELEAEYTHIFRRNDPDPVVKFMDDGRYLPPAGRQALKVETLMVGELATEIRRVEPRNVVQLLAREENVYRNYGRYYWSDVESGADVEELSGKVETNVITCVNQMFVKEKQFVPVQMRDGGSPRGVFLVSIRNGDFPRNENNHYIPGCRFNPNLYRLVCVSDLGLSVRTDKGKVGAWVVSFTTGKPVAAARVEVYSSANILLARGETDAKGWCELPLASDKGEPFAVIARTQAQDDMTFMALRNSMAVEENYGEGSRPAHLKDNEVTAMVWTERGIYRHDEKIFTQVILRDREMRSPKAMPVSLFLYNPDGQTVASKTVVSDTDGTVTYDGFRALAEQPSGNWTICAKLVGEGGKELGSRKVKIEEFAPPQIRVKVDTGKTCHPTNFSFVVSAEHLFGGPARSLACEGAVVFEDVPFAPAKWKGYKFGNDDLGLKPSFRTLKRDRLDDKGCHEYEAPIWADSGRPKAAVRATGQGVVFEDGGRPATMRQSLICHYYPYYVGANLPEFLKVPETGFPQLDFVCVTPDGEPLKGGRKLVGKLERIDSICAYRKNEAGWSTWHCERVRAKVNDQLSIVVGSDGKATWSLPIRECGDYALTVEDPTTGVSFARTFYLSHWGDDAVRAPLANPTEVAIQCDKAAYRVGESPRLLVKAPFAGHALLTVMREGMVYSEVLNLTNATSEVVLRPLQKQWAPNLEVAISVVQNVKANAKHLAVRAHGVTTVLVRPIEHEIPVSVSAAVKLGTTEGEHTQVGVDFQAPGATSAVVTLVDEGINLLTDEKTPNPIRDLSVPRMGVHPFYDLYHRLLPVVDDGLKANGIKTGGGFGAEMLGRVSPVPSRRFKPLALWSEKVSVQDGKVHVDFQLPEFLGEIRVTVVAYSDHATGAASVQCKVTPKLVMQPDAPRFVAPGDEFEITLPLHNTGNRDGEVVYAIKEGGCDQRVHSGRGLPVSGRLTLRHGESTNVVVKVRAVNTVGEMELVFHAEGLDEVHNAKLFVPVRPAIPWRERAGVALIDPKGEFKLAAQGSNSQYRVMVNGSPIAELVESLEWLADYPHGCLEQTTSRIFPLITAGGILNAVAPSSLAATNRAEYVAAGVNRVQSMIRQNDFVMWPDCTYPPWNCEVSLYAAHFLIEAEKAGERLNPTAKAKVLEFLGKWSRNEIDHNIAAYACHTLALAGNPDLDRMFMLYDNRTSFSALARARLARAFVAAHDAKRAGELMKFALEPQSVKEAAFMVLALLELDPNDSRLLPLVTYLNSRRDHSKFSWGTTENNAHALLALGAYYQHHPLKAGEPKVRCSAGGDQPGVELGKRERKTFKSSTLTVRNVAEVPAYLAWRERTLPELATVTNEFNGLIIERRYLKPNGDLTTLDSLACGDLLVVELAIMSDVTREVGDLVIEDLFPGAFEPVHSELAALNSALKVKDDWVMRKDARDDRMLVFSKKVKLEKGHEVKVRYPVRVVSAGDFVLPGPSVEAMYNPELHARCAPGRIVVRH